METSASEAFDNAQSNKKDLEELRNIIRDVPEVIETKAKLARVFNSIHQKMNMGIAYEEILDSIFDSLGLIIPFDRIGIALLEDDRKTLRLDWVKSKLPTKYINKKYVAPLNESSLEKIINSGRPRIINDLQAYLLKHPRSKSTKLILEDGIRSNLTCPIIVDNSPTGVIFFSSAQPNTYKKLHIDVFCEIAGSLAIIIEQALLKKSVKQIHEKEKMFRDTIHDLNNPLWIIQASLEMITRKKWYQDLGEDSKKVFETLKRNCDNMIRIVHELVYRIKDEQIKEREDNKDVLMELFMKNLALDAKAMAEKKNIHFVFDVPEQLPIALKFDEQKVKQALDNLIANAIKYNSDDSNVTVHVRFDLQKMHLKFIITDQGPGITKELLTKIFQEQARNASVTSGKMSSGRGLLNVKRLIQSMDGDVCVESKIGKGTRFEFWIPTLNSSASMH